MLLSVLVGLLLFAGANASFYEVKGYSAAVPLEDVRSQQQNHASAADLEKLIFNQCNEHLGNACDEFILDHFEIHADRFMPTAVFYGHLSVSKSRQELIDGLEHSEDFQLYFIRETGSLPQRSVFVELDDTLSCVNGGVLLPNNTCYCPKFYSGVDCSTVQCLHFGIQDANRCACPPGAYAQNCESRSCLPAVQNTLDSTRQSFVIILNQKITMASVLNDIILYLQSSLEDMIKNGDIFQNYILVSYVQTNGSTFMDKQVFTNYIDMINYTQNSVYIQIGTDSQPTNLAILEAETFTPLIYGFSNIFVFTDSTDSMAVPVDYHFSDVKDIENEVILRTIAWRQTLVYFLSSTGTLNATANSFNVFKRITEATLGDIVSFDPAETYSIVDTLLYYYQRIETTFARYNVPPAGQNFVLNVQDDEDGNGQQFVHVLITVAPGGIMPSVTAINKNTTANKTMDVGGKRFAMYRVWKSVDPSLTLSGGSNYNVRSFVNSVATVLVAYAYDPMVDVGSSAPSADIDQTANALLLGISGSASLTWKDVSQDNPLFPEINAITRTNQDQYECTYPLTFGQIPQKCNPGAFLQVVNVTNSQGYLVRVIPGYCGQLDHHDSPTFTCLNGGTVSDSTCICGPNFTGQKCEVPVCVNGGTVNPFPVYNTSLCLCNAGYSGNFCEKLICSSSAPPVDENIRSIVVVLQSSMSQAFINSQIVQGIQALVSQYGSLANMFVLETFKNIINLGNTTSIFVNQQFTNSTAFIAAMDPSQVKYTASPSANVDTIGAALDAMLNDPNSESDYFIFADSAMIMVNMSNYEKLKLFSITKMHKLNIIVTAPFGSPASCMNSTAANSYRDLAYSTGGLYLNLCSSNLTAISAMFTIYGQTTNGTKNLNEMVTTCSSGISLSYFTYDESPAPVLVINSDKTMEFSASLKNKYDDAITELQPALKTSYLAYYNLQAGNTDGYTVEVSPASSSVDGQCSLRISQQSTVSSLVGFSQNPSQDRTGGVVYYGTEASPVLQFQGLKSDVTPQFTINNETGSSFYTNTPVIRDSSCNYKYYFTNPFVCSTSNGAFISVVTAQTPQGTIQRSRRTLCYNDFSCINGQKTQAGPCNCSSYWTGDYCEIPICQNGGTLNGYYCSCTPKFSGRLCEYEICNQFNYLEAQDFRNQQFNQITFVLNRNQDQLLVNILLNNLMASFVNSVETLSNPKQYSLITFDENGVYDVISSSRPGEFIQLFNSASSVFKNTTATKTKSLDAIVEAIRINIRPPSIVYLFTGSSYLTSTNTLYSALKQQLGTQINIFYTPSTSTVGQPDSYLALVARQTGGRILPLSQLAVSNLLPVLQSSILENQLVHDNAAKDCTGGFAFKFYPGINQGSQLVLLVTGNGVTANGAVSAVDDTGSPVLFNSTLFADTSAAGAVIYTIQSAKPDQQITVTVKTTSGNCFLQARLITSLKIDTGFTEDQNNDFVADLPYSKYAKNKTTYMTIRASDQSLGVSGNLISNVEVYSGDFDKPYNDYGLLQTLPVIRRDMNGCAYQFVTSAWAINSPHFQKIVIYGKDTAGVLYQRTSFFSLTAYRNEDATTCVNGTRSEYGQCQCDSLHTGEFCIDRLCQNGGTSSNGICICSNGYYGNNCEQELLN